MLKELLKSLTLIGAIFGLMVMLLNPIYDRLDNITDSLNRLDDRLTSRIDTLEGRIYDLSQQPYCTCQDNERSD